MKNLQNLKYLLRHKYYVFIAGLTTGVPIWRLLIHDWSKFGRLEWESYREYFYDKRPEYKEWVENRGWQDVVDEEKLAELDRPRVEYNDCQFLYGWLHHQHKNPHHWQHWLLKCDNGRMTALDMPDIYIREMVADWVGAGLAINGKVEVRSWYERNKQHMVLSPNTQKRVEELLELF